MKRIWRSVFRGPILPRDDRERKWIVFNHLLLHFRPVYTGKSTLRFTHTFGLGGMSLVLVLMAVTTGVLLMFVYEPVPGNAYESISRLQRDMLFGKFVRSVHYWSANFLLVVVLFHLLRTYFTGAYLEPRQFNWVIGLFLLLCVLAANFTGYLLPWDQLSYWAITISTGMLEYIPTVGDEIRGIVLGGPEIGQATLINFYTLHTTLVPVTIFALMAFHFWRVRKAGGVVVPRAPGEEPEQRPEKLLALPNLLYREFVTALALIAGVLIISALFTAPLGEIANPGMSPNPAKPPWYFVGVQEMLLHFHPTVAVLVLPLAGTIALLVIPYLAYDRDRSGVWFGSDAGRRLAVLAAPVAMVGSIALVLLDEYVTGFGPSGQWLSGAAGNGVFRVALVSGVLGGLYVWLRKRLGASRADAVQTLFIVCLTGIAALTVIGLWFRGPGMVLTW